MQFRSTGTIIIVIKLKKKNNTAGGGTGQVLLMYIKHNLHLIVNHTHNV